MWHSTERIKDNHKYKNLLKFFFKPREIYEIILTVL